MKLGDDTTEESTILKIGGGCAVTNRVLSLTTVYIRSMAKPPEAVSISDKIRLHVSVFFNAIMIFKNLKRREGALSLDICYIVLKEIVAFITFSYKNANPNP